MDFYKQNTENWTCVNLVEFYRANSKQKERKKVLDNIKKDLEKVVRSKSGFDATRKKKAQKIINNWKVCSIINKIAI